MSPEQGGNKLPSQLARGRWINPSGGYLWPPCRTSLLDTPNEGTKRTGQQSSENNQPEAKHDQSNPHSTHSVGTAPRTQGGKPGMCRHGSDQQERTWAGPRKPQAKGVDARPAVAQNRPPPQFANSFAPYSADNGKILPARTVRRTPQ